MAEDEEIQEELADDCGCIEAAERLSQLRREKGRESDG